MRRLRLGAALRSDDLMTDPRERIHLLGPQRLRPTLRAALDEAHIGGRVATVTAGWEEREGEDDELRAHVGRDVVDLRVWSHFEAVFAQDPELFRAMQERYGRTRRLRTLYLRQLAHALEAARQLLRDGAQAPGADDELLREAQQDAIEAVRAIDARHAARRAEIHADFSARLALHEHPLIQAQRDELRQILESCDALCIAGGHVGILLNRLLGLAVLDLWGQRPLFAWSAGAMALTERVVLFHDSPPQGAGDAEVFDAGAGLVDDLVLLPHASRRLMLEDPIRVALFAQRFAPRACVALDDGARLRFANGAWQRVEAARTLRASGAVEDMQELAAR